MSTTIDQRVVEMRFDNQNFERNVQTSMSTIEKLKEKLNLKGVSKGLEEVNSAAKKCDFSPMSSAVDGVKVKFSAMEVMAVTALANITNSAVNAGKRIVSALTIEPITTGFNEYELKMNSVQTIMASTGENINTVNKYLDELNEYSDKTIYSFSDMTQNIGKFTNAGVKLEDAVLAIKGISNEAAVSGANANEASRAMYNFAQALSSGSVRLIDWKSIENANMATVEFKDTLIETAVELGTVTKVGDKYQSTTTDLNGKVSELFTSTTMFNDSLSSQWMTTDVLINTLKKYSDETTDLGKKAYGAAQDVKTLSQLWDTLKEAAQSGWARTWELIIGDLEEAKKLWTVASKFFGGIIDKMSNSRNAILESALGKTFIGISEKIEKAIAPAKKAVDTVNNVKEAVSDLGDVVNNVIVGKFGNGQERIDKLTAAGQNYYRVQNKVNETLGISFRFTDEQIAAQDKLLGTQSKVTDGTKEETAETGKLTEGKKNLIKKIASMTEEQMRANGYTDEQIAAFKELGKTADKLGIPLDEFIDKMDEIDGRWLLIESFKNIGKSLVEVFKAIGAAWKNIFPTSQDEQAEKLFNIIAAFHKFSSTILTAATNNAENFRRTFEGLFAIIDIVRTIVGGALGAAFKLLKTLLGSTNVNILDITAGIGDVLVAFRDWIKENNFIVKALENVVSFVQKVIDKLKEFGLAIADNIELPNINGLGDIFETISEKIRSAIDKFKEFIGLCKNSISSPGLENITTIFGAIGSVFSTLFEAIGKIGMSIGDVLVDIFSKGDVNAILDTINAGLIASVILGIKSIVDNLKSSLDISNMGVFETIKDTFSGITGVLDSVRGSLETWQQSLKAEIILKIAIAMGILVASIYALSSIDSDKLTESLGAITLLFADLLGSLALFEKVNPTGSAKAMGQLLAMSVSVLILASALKKIASIDTQQLIGAIGGVAALSEVLVLVAKQLSGNTVTTSATAMIAFAIAVRVLASALKVLSDLSWEQLAIGIAGIYALSAGMVVALNNMKGTVGGAAAMLVAAIALQALTPVLLILGSMSLESIGKGLLAIGMSLAELVLALNLMKGTVGGAAALLVAAIALQALTPVLLILGKMSLEEIGRGLLAIGGSLAILVIALNLMKSAIPGAAALLIASAALLMLAPALRIVSGMDMEGVGRGLLAIGGCLAELAIALNLMNAALPGAAALLVAAAALAILAPVLVLLGSLSLKEIGMALLTLAGAFLVIGAAGLVLTPLIPAILGLAAAMALIGVSILGLGLGLTMVAAGLTALAAAGTAAVASVVAMIKVFVVGLTSMLPQIVVLLNELIKSIALVLADSVPVLIDAILKVITELLVALVEYGTPIVQAVVDILILLLAAIRDNIDEILVIVVDVLIRLIEAIANKLPDIVQAGVDIIINLIDGLAQGIEDNAPRLRDAFIHLGESILKAICSFFGIHSPSTKFAEIGKNLILGLIEGIGKMISKVVNKIVDLGKKMISAIANKAKEFLSKGKELISNLASGISSKMSDVKSKVTTVVTNAVNVVKSKLSEFKAKGSEIMTKLKDGISNKASDIKTAAKNVITGAVNGLKEKVTSFTSVGKDMIGGLKKGIENAATNVVSAAKGVVTNAIDAAKKLLGINSPSRVFAEIGRYTDEGFANGLTKYASKVTHAAEKMGEKPIGALSNSISRIVDMLNGDMDYQPTIRPVLDLSDVRSGVGAMNGMFGITPSVGVLANVGAISSAMNNNQNGINDDIISAIRDLGSKLGSGSGDVYNINGVTYDDDSNISNAVKVLVRAAKVERRI